MAIELIFLGSGAAFTVENYHSNMLIQIGQKRLLIDCGSDIRRSLAEKNLTFNEIDGVYVSHLHADHAGGLESLGFTRYVCCKKKKRPELHLNASLIEPLWNNVLKGGLSSFANIVPSLETFFNVHPIAAGFFTWEAISFETVQTVHTYNGSVLNPSYGLFFKLNNTKIFISTDTQFVPKIMIPFYERADLIFHDCETNRAVSTVHARFEELAELPSHLKQKMWLYHYNDGEKPNAVAAGFLGYVPKGKVFEF